MTKFSIYWLRLHLPSICELHCFVLYFSLGLHPENSRFSFTAWNFLTEWYSSARTVIERFRTSFLYWCWKSDVARIPSADALIIAVSVRSRRCPAVPHETILFQLYQPPWTPEREKYGYFDAMYWKFARSESTMSRCFSLLLLELRHVDWLMSALCWLFAPLPSFLVWKLIALIGFLLRESLLSLFKAPWLSSSKQNYPLYNVQRINRISFSMYLRTIVTGSECSISLRLALWKYFPSLL